QLKMVLSVNNDLSAPLRAEIARRAEYVATNPLENDSRTEIEVAANQYRALLEYVRRPEGLRARLDRDRRAELAASFHGGAARSLFQVARVATVGLYTHRERASPMLAPLLEVQRRSLSQKAFLQDVVKSGSHIDVVWDVEKVRNSLRGASDNEFFSQDTLAATTYQIFTQTRHNTSRRFSIPTFPPFH